MKKLNQTEQNKSQELLIDIMNNHMGLIYKAVKHYKLTYVEDIVEDIIVKLVQYAPTYRHDKSKLSTWVQLIASSYCQSYITKLNRDCRKIDSHVLPCEDWTAILNDNTVDDSDPLNLLLAAESVADRVKKISFWRKSIC